MPRLKQTPADATLLEHYEHVSLYDSAFRTRKEDVLFFRQLAEGCGGPILEYGAGSGRVTLPLAKAGHHVTAVDASRPMLARLHQRLRKAPQAVQSNVRPLHGDMRNLRLSGRFPLVLATFNVVGHLATFKDMGRFLTHARAHLAPGGRLAFDVPLPHGDEIEADPDELFPAPRFRHPDTKEWIYQTERFEYSPGTQQLLVESSYRAGDRPDILTVPLVLRQWFPKELEAILYFEGFSQVQTFADYTQNPGLFARDSLVFVAAV